MPGKPLTTSFMNGLPPHIAQVICGHRDISTTMGYKAIYPAEAIEAHRAFIARRRQARPSEEYRTPTDEEWDEFLAHFEKRKLSTGTCARAFGTPCIHEHACLTEMILRWMRAFQDTWRDLRSQEDLGNGRQPGVSPRRSGPRDQRQLSELTAMAAWIGVECPST